MISSIHAYSLEWLCQWKTQQLYRPYRPSGTLSWTYLNSLSLYHQYRCFLEELLEAPESAQDQLKDLGDGFVWGNYSTLNLEDLQSKVNLVNTQMIKSAQHILAVFELQEIAGSGDLETLGMKFLKRWSAFYLFLERYVSFLVMMFLDNQGAFPAVGLWWWRDCWRRRVLWRCAEGRGSSSDTDSAVLKWTITDSLADKGKLVFC